MLPRGTWGEGRVQSTKVVPCSVAAPSVNNNNPNDVIPCLSPPAIRLPIYNTPTECHTEQALRNDYVIAAQGTMMRLQAISDGLQNRDPPITKRLENGSETEFYCVIITGWRRFQPQFILLIFDEYFQTAVIILSASGDTYNHPTPLFRNTVPPPHPNTCRPFTIFCLS